MSVESWKTARVAGRPWQDWLFSVAGGVFVAGLIPMLVAGTRVPLMTGLTTAALLYAFAVAHASYGNWLAVLTECCTATVWLLLAVGA